MSQKSKSMGTKGLSQCSSSHPLVLILGKFDRRTLTSCRHRRLSRAHRRSTHNACRLVSVRLALTTCKCNQQQRHKMKAAAVFGVRCCTCTPLTVKLKGMTGIPWLSPDPRADRFRCWINNMTFHTNLSFSGFV